MPDQGLSRRAFLAATTTSAVLAVSGCTTVNTARVVPKKFSPNQQVAVREARQRAISAAA